MLSVCPGASLLGEEGKVFVELMGGTWSLHPLPVLSNPDRWTATHHNQGVSIVLANTGKVVSVYSLIDHSEINAVNCCAYTLPIYEPY